jgi:predicted enzyme related to lactoylglutathione lyase
MSEQETTMDPYRTHGAFSWAELTTRDPAAAQEFYRKLFGWTAREMALPAGAYTTFQVGDSTVGGMMRVLGEAAGTPPTWGVYVTVTDVDATVEQAKALGGKVIAMPREIPGVGRMAVIEDPQGARLSVITYSMSG